MNALLLGKDTIETYKDKLLFPELVRSFEEELRNQVKIYDVSYKCEFKTKLGNKILVKVYRGKEVYGIKLSKYK